MEKYCMVLTTFGSKENADKVIKAVIECKLAACAQTIDIASHYVWKEKVCHEQEILVLFKTSWGLYNKLEAKIKELHSYEVPEIIAIDIKDGLKGYFDWIDQVTENYAKD